FGDPSADFGRGIDSESAQAEARSRRCRPGHAASCTTFSAMSPAAHGIEAYICTCKNPDLSAGCCNIADRPPAPVEAWTQLTLFAVGPALNKLGPKGTRTPRQSVARR
ncbi:MAG: hypothetical protein ACYSWU_22605, partial [Planctomycetota bacterium]